MMGPVMSIDEWSDEIDDTGLNMYSFFLLVQLQAFSDVRR
jgi:hypothetical protein